MVAARASDFSRAFLRHQWGAGDEVPYYASKVHFQRGRGFGTFIKAAWSGLLKPFLMRGAKQLGSEAFNTSRQILEDLTQSENQSGQRVKEVALNRLGEGWERLKQRAMSGSGRRRKRARAMRGRGALRKDKVTRAVARPSVARKPLPKKRVVRDLLL